MRFSNFNWLDPDPVKSKLQPFNRGRGLAFKQYLPQKPAKYGFLFKSLGDSQHAYIYRLSAPVLQLFKLENTKLKIF